jgi:hypothetical protein
VKALQPTARIAVIDSVTEPREKARGLETRESDLAGVRD